MKLKYLELKQRFHEVMSTTNDPSQEIRTFKNGSSVTYNFMELWNHMLTKQKNICTFTYAMETVVR